MLAIIDRQQVRMMLPISGRYYRSIISLIFGSLDHKQVR